MEPPVFRLDVLDGQTGAVITRQAIEPAEEDNNTFKIANWPIDADARATFPSPQGYPLEVRIRRIL